MPLLLDNNVFRALTHNTGQGDRARFIRDIRAKQLIKSDRASFALTSFSLLEAIGIVPPSASFAFTPLPIEPGHEADAVERMSDEILRQALEFYEQAAVLTEANLLVRAQEQRTYTRQDALSFFDRCITNVLKQPEARRHMIACLAVDSLFKFDFPSQALPYFHARFLAMLFSEDEIDNSASLFRVMKKIWDEVYTPMYLDQKSFDRERLIKARKHMELKKDRDYVDCDLIHYLCVGYVADGRRSPVIACTTDDLETIVTRIAVFKTIRERYSEAALEMTGRTPDEAPRHEQGVVVHCTPDVQLREIIRVADIPALT